MIGITPYTHVYWPWKKTRFNIWNYFEKLPILLLVTWTTTTSNTPMPLLIECTFQIVIEYNALFMGYVIYLQTGITLCCHFCAIRRSELPPLQDKPLQNFIHSEQANCSACTWTRFYIHDHSFIDTWQPKLAPTIQRRILLNESLRKQSNLTIEWAFAV